MKNNPKKLKLTKKMMTRCIASILALSIVPAELNASDMQIYQNPMAANNPIIMLAIDNSWSMQRQDTKYKGKNTSRLNTLINSLVDSLNAKNLSGQYVIPENIVMGASIFTPGSDRGNTPDWKSSMDTARTAKIYVEAKPLTKQHRDFLIKQIKAIPLGAGTPTPLILSETYAYLLGNSTYGPNLDQLDSIRNQWYSDYTRGLSGVSLAPQGAVKSDRRSFVAPLTKLKQSDAMCSTQGVFFLTDGAPAGLRPPTVEPVMQNAVADPTFSCENSPLQEVYYNYANASFKNRYFFDFLNWINVWDPAGARIYNGEFSEMANDVYNNKNFIVSDSTGYYKNDVHMTWQNRSSWGCVGKMVQRLANYESMTADPNKKRIYTATVGFGPLFTVNDKEDCEDLNGDGLYDHCQVKREDYDPNPGTQTQAPVVTNALNAQALKIIGNRLGKGDTFNTRNEIGGYTYTDNGEDIQRALLSFLGAASKGNFDAVSFGNYVVPFDKLDPHNAHEYIYSSQFQPKIASLGNEMVSTHQLWLGNLKKYSVRNGINANPLMVDRNNAEILDSRGRIQANTLDYWNKSGEFDGVSAIKGGALSNLKTPFAPSATNAKSNTSRPLYTNATISSSGADAYKVVGTSDGQLTALDVDQILNAKYIDQTQTGWKKNKYQPYLLSALGYKLEEGYLNTLPDNYVWDAFNKVKDLPVMKQMGGVAHSLPLLLTLDAKFSKANGAILPSTENETNRQDFLVFGTMQGLLHVINQKNGEEVFSFLPDEILQDPNRRDALLEQNVGFKETNNALYGLDGTWVSDVSYTTDQNAGTIRANKANIYGGMRMGGRSYYAFDLKNIAKPSLLFQIDPASGTVKSKVKSVRDAAPNDAIRAMGQSWSTPTISKIRFDGKVRNVMIVGGGYDPAYEAFNYDPHFALTNGLVNQGAGVYIFDAETGELLWNVRHGRRNNSESVDASLTDMKFSIVSQIKAFDRNSDGLVDQLYFGDLGGQVWRVDLNNDATVDKNQFGRTTRLADFRSLNQRFYEQPTVTIHESNGQRYGAVSISSGNRSHPLNADNKYDNRIYVIHDHDIANPELLKSGYQVMQNINESQLFAWSEVTSNTIPDLMSQKKKGWYYVLRNTSNQLEPANTGTVKALNPMVAIANSKQHSALYVSLFNPNAEASQASDSCAGGIRGSSRILKLCLPYGVCGKTSGATLDIEGNKKIEFVSNITDGITRINTVPVVKNGKMELHLLNGERMGEGSSPRVKADSWSER